MQFWTVEFIYYYGEKKINKVPEKGEQAARTHPKPEGQVKRIAAPKEAR
jgi:hypothetical protein